MFYVQKTFSIPLSNNNNNNNDNHHHQNLSMNDNSHHRVIVPRRAKPPPIVVHLANVCSLTLRVCLWVFVVGGWLCTACSEKSGHSMNSNSSAFGGGGGDYSSLSTLSEDFPAELIHELEAAAGANGNDRYIVN